MNLDPLYDAAIAGNADARAKLEMQTDILNKDEYTILHTEAKKGNAERVRFILREFAHKNLLTKSTIYKHTALHLAIYEGHTEVAEVLIHAATDLPPPSFQAFLRQGDFGLDSALHAAVTEGNITIVKLLVEADPTDRHIQNYEGKTPMYIAVEKGYNEIVEIISTTCTDPSLDGPDGSGVVRINDLHQVESHGGTLYKIKDRYDFYDAAIAGDADARAKLEMQADKLGEKEYTILHTEAKKGNAQRVRFLLKEFASKNLLVKLNKYKHTALHLAALHGHTEVAEVLIHAARDLPPSSFQAFLRQGDKDMDTALHAAVLRGNVAIVKLLVEADPTDRHIQNHEGKTPMYIAVEKGLNEIVDIISTTCTDPSLDGPYGDTVVRINDLDQVDSPGGTLYKIKDRYAFYDAAIAGDAEAIAKLEMEADKLDYYDQTILHAESRRGKTECVRFLLKEFANKNLLVKLNKYKRTALHLAALHGHTEVAEVLIDAATHLPNDDTHDNPVTSFQAFLRRGDEDGDTALHCAALFGHVDIVKLLVEADPTDRHSQNAEGKTPMYIAAKRGYLDVVKIMCTTCTVPINLDGPGTTTALHAVIKKLDKETALRLLDKDNEFLVNFIDDVGWTALHHAAYHELNEVIKPIVEAQKKFGHEFVYPDKRPTPFHVAAQKGFTSTVILLFQLWPSSSCTYIATDKDGQNILHLAALQSKKEMIQAILKHCPEEYKKELVNKQDNNGNTPLHVLIRRGCLVPELLRYQGLDTTVKNDKRWTPRDMLYVEDEIIEDQVKIKIALDHIQIDEKRDIFPSSVLSISKREEKDVIMKKQADQMIYQMHARMKGDTRAVANCFADAIAGDPISKAALEMEADTLQEEGKTTILHIESMRGVTERVEYILREFAIKNLLVKLDISKQTALHLAAHHGHTQVVEALIEAARHLPSSSANDDIRNPIRSFEDFIRQTNGQMGNTALHLAVLNGKVAIVKLLVQADPNDNHVQNKEGKTPIYTAVEKGYKDIVEEICRTCTALSLDGPGGRTTALHALIQNISQVTEGASDMIRMIVPAARRWSSAQGPALENFEALFSTTDESGRTVSQLAVEKNHVDAVRLILEEDPAYQRGHEIKRNGLMRLIYKAIDNKCNDDIVKFLSQTYKFGIEPRHENVLALILAIKSLDEDSVLSLLENSKYLVTFAEDNGWTPLHYAAFHEFDSILGAMIQAQEEVGHKFEYGHMVSTPFDVAVKHGHTFTLLQLMELWPVPSSPSVTDYSPYTTVNEDGRNILHLAAAKNNKEMVQGILKYCPKKYEEKILKQQDNSGDTPLHLLISHGCFVPELIKHKRLDTMAKNKNNFTPRDMLYIRDEIVSDQVQIKIALDGVQTNQSIWKPWGPKRTEKKTDSWKSNAVSLTRRKIKDRKFEEGKKLLMDAEHEQMKKDLERYRMRTNTQIIVTALITTVTFTVGFTMPGGLYQSGDVNEGLVVLSRKRVFNAFMVSDAIALLLSTSSLFFYFLESMNEDLHQVSKLNTASTVLNIVSVVAMMLTFITGTYVVLSHSPALAITVSVIGSLFFLLIIVLSIKIVYKRKIKRNED